MCVAGHVSCALARHANVVTAVDLSPDRLAAVAATARSKGLSNIETVEAAAGQWPFEDGRVDFPGVPLLCASWRDLDDGLREAHRVLRCGRRVVLVDACSPNRALVDTRVQAVALLRDSSHVRIIRSRNGPQP